MLTKFTGDLDIIAALDDEPNDVGGMSAAELKAKFDEGGKALAEYINDTLTEEIDAVKQDAIDDLETIRSGAAAGATAVQPEAGKGLFSGNYNDLTNKPNTVKWAVYGMSHAYQIYLDINAGYVVCCKYNSRVYVCETAYQSGSTSNYYAYFYSGDQCLRAYNTSWNSDYAASLQRRGDMTSSVPDAGDNTHYPTTKAVRDALNEKQDTISDLETIRSGAALGATALQSVPDTYRTAAEQDVIDAGKVNTADYDPAEKTSAMTQPVGKDANGKLWTAPGGGGGGGGDMTAAVYDPDGGVADAGGIAGYVAENADASGAAAGVQTNLTSHEGDTAKHVTASERTAWNAKQDTISDLETIRSGAALGATALQSVPNTYRTAAAQDTIDAGKQSKITASGILKGNGAGGVSAATAGTDYVATNDSRLSDARTPTAHTHGSISSDGKIGGAALDNTLVKLVNGALQTLGGTPVAGGAKIKLGSYVGTGYYGSTHKNSIVCDFPISVAFVYDRNTVGAIFMRDRIKYTIFTDGDDNGDAAWSADYKTLEWYASNRERQLNLSGTTYYYIIIG